jgi:hypothetical protein
MKLTVELGTVNRTNWGAPEDCTLLVKNPATGEQVATVRYSFDETDAAGADGEPTVSSIGSIRCEADIAKCPGDPIMVAACALKAIYDKETSEHEFLAFVFDEFPVIEFEV